MPPPSPWTRPPRALFPWPCSVSWRSSGELSLCRLTCGSTRRTCSCVLLNPSFKCGSDPCPVLCLDVCVEEEEENSERSAWRKARPEVITFTEEETAQLAKTQPQESATVSEQVLVQSAAEKDRVSELKDRQAELEAEPRFANRCSYCPKSFKKPSDLVRWAAWRGSALSPGCRHRGQGGVLNLRPLMGSGFPELRLQAGSGFEASF